MKPDFPVVGHIHSFGVPTIYKVSFLVYSSFKTLTTSPTYTYVEA